MSFFSSLQQYVTSGVAGLGLSGRRFSLSRQDSSEGADKNAQPGAAQGAAGAAVPGTVAGSAGGGTAVGLGGTANSSHVHGK